MRLVTLWFKTPRVYVLYWQPVCLVPKNPVGSNSASLAISSHGLPFLYAIPCFKYVSCSFSHHCFHLRSRYILGTISVQVYGEYIWNTRLAYGWNTRFISIVIGLDYMGLTFHASLILCDRFSRNGILSLCVFRKIPSVAPGLRMAPGGGCGTRVTQAECRVKVENLDSTCREGTLMGQGPHL